MAYFDPQYLRPVPLWAGFLFSASFGLNHALELSICAAAISSPLRTTIIKSEYEMSAETAAPQSRTFEADVAKLLHLMVHSVYSDKDIFLRELISNAADACEKLRYEALDRKSVV